jgi:bacillithiol system protein YtxJ
MHWNKIDSEQALDEVILSSHQAPVLIFKHSYRCAISGTAFSRLERAWDSKAASIKTYLVDVIAERPLSQLIAKKLDIVHESPQAILLKDGKAVYAESHLGISYGYLVGAVNAG